MALVVPNVGEVLLLTRMLADDVVVHLFTDSDVDPDDDTVLADFTEATAEGYESVTLIGTGGVGSEWTIETNLEGVTTAEYAEIEFTFTEASTNYGYFVTDSAGTGLLWAEKFTDAPHTLPSGGGTEKITIRISAD